MQFEIRPFYEDTTIEKRKEVYRADTAVQLLYWYTSRGFPRYWVGDRGSLLVAAL